MSVRTEDDEQEEMEVLERGDGDSSEQREGGWRKGESVLGFVGAGSEGPQGGRWGMVRDDGILVCRVPPPPTFF